MSGAWKKALCVAALAAAIFAVYGGTLKFGFVFDDNEQILKNPWITDMGSSLEAFRSYSFGWKEGYAPLSYRPMVFLVFAAEYALFGFEPWGWHFAMLAFHAVNSALLFLLILRLVPGAVLPAFAGALLFAVHAANAEPLSWAGCVPELSYTMLCLLALNIEAASLEKKGAGGLIRPGRALAAALFFVALLFKETSVAIPALVLVHDLVRNGLRDPVRRAIGYAPYAAAFLVYLVLRSSALGGGIAPPERLHSYLDAATFALNSMVLFSRYLTSLVWPTSAPMQLLEPVYSVADARAVAAAALIALAIALAAAFTVKVSRLGLLAFAAIALPILPALYSPAVSMMPFAERYLYLPVAGVGLVLAIGLGRLLAATGGGRRVAAFIVAGLVLMALPHALWARHRSAVWESDAVLWAAALRAQSGNYVAMHSIGYQRLEEGRLDEAMALLEEAMRLNLSGAHPDMSAVLLSRRTLTNAYLRAGLLDKAKDNLVEYLALAPEDPLGRYNLGLIDQTLGDCAGALESYELARILARKPGLLASIHFNMGQCYSALGMGQRAEASYAEAARHAPGGRP